MTIPLINTFKVRKVKMMKKAIVSALFASLLPVVAHAELVKYDNVVFDTQTGLTWLQLSETAGLSINQVLNGAGGWTRRDPLVSDSTVYRYATGREVATLVEHYGMYASDYTTGNFGAGRFVFGIGGSTSPQGYAGTWFSDGNQGAIGMSFDAFVSATLTNGDNGSPLSPTCDRYMGCERVIIDYSPRFDQLDYADARVGSFLVAIPEPETVALLGVGLLAFAASRRKKTK